MKRIAREPTPAMIEVSRVVAILRPEIVTGIWRIMHDAAPDADAGRVQITIGLPTIHALVRGEAVELEHATLYGASDLQTWGQWTENDGRHDPERVAELQRRIEEARQVLAWCHTPESEKARAILRGDSDA